MNRPPPLVMRPIGVIRTPFREAARTPIQPQGALGTRGRVELLDEFEEGLRDLDGFSHVILLYAFHRCEGYALVVKPYAEDVERGLFATRAPRRPNAIGLSVVRLVSVERTTLEVEDVDMLDGTPLLDIKPYIPAIDCRAAERIGWVSGRESKFGRVKADGRFSAGGK